MHENYPCDKLLRIAEKAKNPALSILWETFGDSTECARRFFDKFKDRETLLQVHFSNEVCRKGGRCADNAFPGDSTREYNRRLEEFSEETIGVLWRRLDDIKRFIYATANPNTFVVIGGGLEDRYTRKAWDNLGNFLYFNSIFAVSRNPSGGSKNSDYAAAMETHSTAGQPAFNCIANEDGNDQSKDESRAFLDRYKSCLAVFLWDSTHQGYELGGPKPPHKERTFRIPAKDVIKYRDLLSKAPQ